MTKHRVQKEWKMWVKRARRNIVDHGVRESRDGSESFGDNTARWRQISRDSERRREKGAEL